MIVIKGPMVAFKVVEPDSIQFFLIPNSIKTPKSFENCEERSLGVKSILVTSFWSISHHYLCKFPFNFMINSPVNFKPQV